MRGFTLLELSIVLVVIGLIVGGVITGQSLIRNAELNSVASDFNRYASATNAFQYKYNAWPGDMPNASTYWTSCVTVFPIVCNGNGDGSVTLGPTNAGDGSRYMESVTAWVHLSNAGMVPGTYAIPAGLAAVAGSAPSGKIDNTLFTFGTSSTGGSMGLSFGRPGTAVLQNQFYATLLPIDAEQIDRKLDDGRPDTGRMRGLVGVDAATAEDCGTAATNAYVATTTTPACYLALRF